LGGATGSGGTAASGGATGSGGTTSAGGATGSGGAADGGGSGKGGAIGSGGATTGGGGATGTGGSAGAGGGGAANCAGRAISMSANGTSSDSDSALSRVEIDLKTDLPIGNSKRTIEYWAYIKTTDWVGDKNEMYFYGGTVSAGEFGMDFGTNPVAGMSGNHATLDPFTNGGFSDDSTDYLGVTSSINQWVHIAMVWDGTNLLTYVNGQLKITTMGTGGITALATAQSILTIGCNPTNNACFNGFFDEFRVWNVARSATDIQNNYNTPMTGNETGLVGYWKFDEASGTTAADAVTAAGHTAHNGTLKADAIAHNPTFVTPPVPLPLVCNRAGN
jgi:large repetitive protein